MFSIFLDEAIFKPLAESLRNRQSGGGGGGFLSSLLNSGASLLGSGGGGPPSTAGGMDLRMFSRASGGYVGPGQVVRVNEHKGTGVELLRMGRQGGTVIPLGQVNQRAAQPAGQGAGVTTVRLELSRCPHHRRRRARYGRGRSSDGRPDQRRGCAKSHQTNDHAADVGWGRCMCHVGASGRRSPKAPTPLCSDDSHRRRDRDRVGPHFTNPHIIWPCESRRRAAP